MDGGPAPPGIPWLILRPALGMSVLPRLTAPGWPAAWEPYLPTGGAGRPRFRLAPEPSWQAARGLGPRGRKPAIIATLGAEG